MSESKKNRWILPALGGVALLALLASLPRGEAPDEETTPPADAAPVPRAADAAPAAASDEAAEAPRAAEAPDAEDEAEMAALVERQAELEADPDIQVVCEIEPPIPQATGYLGIDGHSDLDGRIVQVVLGRAYLPLVIVNDRHAERAAFEGWLSVAGYAPTAIAFTGPGPDGERGHCAPEPVRLASGETVVSGTVTHAGNGEPARRAWVEGCGNFSQTDRDGHYYMEVVPAPCRLIAMRQDGQLRTTSEVVEVTPVADRDTVVDFVIPGWPRAGMGAMVTVDDEGVLIEDLIEGGGAEEAGLQAGDLVLAVDGEPTVEMDLGEFVEVIGGQAGTEVALLVETDGAQREITMVRREVY